MVTDGTFPVSTQENRFKQSSTALLAITFIIFTAYSVSKFMIQRATNFGLDVSFHTVLSPARKEARCLRSCQ